MSLIEDVNRIVPEMVELRFDLLGMRPSEVIKLINPSIKVIATCRPGGNFMNSGEILTEAIELGVACIDVEIEMQTEQRAELLEKARKGNVTSILSFHDFNSTPETSKLESLLVDCYHAGADIAKIACQVNDQSDIARLLSLYRHSGRKVVLGMGALGRITRIAAMEIGAEFTFASVDRRDATAPGQLTYEELLEIKKILHTS